MELFNNYNAYEWYVIGNSEILGEGGDYEGINAYIPRTDNENDEMVRVKEVFLPPMDIEEAITRMEALGHNFFLYKDKEDDILASYYKKENDKLYFINFNIFSW